MGNRLPRATTILASTPVRDEGRTMCPGTSVNALRAVSLCQCTRNRLRGSWADGAFRYCRYFGGGLGFGPVRRSTGAIGQNWRCRGSRSARNPRARCKTTQLGTWRSAATADAPRTSYRAHCIPGANPDNPGAVADCGFAAGSGFNHQPDAAGVAPDWRSCRDTACCIITTVWPGCSAAS